MGEGTSAALQWEYLGRQSLRPVSDRIVRNKQFTHVPLYNGKRG